MPGVGSTQNFSESKYGFWEGHIQAQARSGLTIKEYCRRHDISRHTFGYWKKKIGEAKERSEQISVVPIGRLHCGDFCGLRIRTRNGHIVEVRGEFSCSDVAGLIKELE